MKKVAILLTISCVLIFILALTASVGIVFLPATDMRMWGIRSFAYQSLSWCCLVYPALLQIVDTSLPSIAATRPNTALALWGRARPAGHPAARLAA